MPYPPRSGKVSSLGLADAGTSARQDSWLHQEDGQTDGREDGAGRRHALCMGTIKSLVESASSSNPEGKRHHRSREGGEREGTGGGTDK